MKRGIHDVFQEVFSDIFAFVEEMSKDLTFAGKKYIESVMLCALFLCIVALCWDLFHLLKYGGFRIQFVSFPEKSFALVLLFIFYGVVSSKWTSLEVEKESLSVGWGKLKNSLASLTERPEPTEEEIGVAVEKESVVKETLEVPAEVSKIPTAVVEEKKENPFPLGELIEDLPMDNFFEEPPALEELPLEDLRQAENSFMKSKEQVSKVATEDFLVEESLDPISFLSDEDLESTIEPQWENEESYTFAELPPITNEELQKQLEETRRFLPETLDALKPLFGEEDQKLLLGG